MKAGQRLRNYAALRLDVLDDLLWRPVIDAAVFDLEAVNPNAVTKSMAAACSSRLRASLSFSRICASIAPSSASLDLSFLRA